MMKGMLYAIPPTALGRQIVQQLPESPTDLQRQGAFNVPLHVPAEG